MYDGLCRLDFRLLETLATVMKPQRLSETDTRVGAELLFVHIQQWSSATVTASVSLARAVWASSAGNTVPDRAVCRFDAAGAGLPSVSVPA